MPIPVAPLDAPHATTLDRDGCLLLSAAVPTAWLDPLRAAFDMGAEAQWSAPRGPGWRHALVDLDITVQQTCRRPLVLSAVGHLAGGPFLLAQVEGREPLLGAGHQPLHRDGGGIGAIGALVYLDAYGPENGATRVVPRALDTGEPDETLAVTLAGEAGDVLILAPDLLHGATINRSGARRRSLLISYVVEAHRAGQDASRAVRGVRMDTSESFVPRARLRSPAAPGASSRGARRRSRRAPA